MRGLGKRLSFLALLALVSVAFVGAAQALWREELTVTTNVATGTLAGDLSCTNPSDNEASGWSNDQPFAAYPSHTPLTDVASMSVNATTPQHFDITVKGGYPGYAARCDIQVKNTGSVAWHLESIAFTVQQCDENGANCTALGAGHPTWTTACGGTVCAWGDKGADPAHSPVFASVPDDEGCQVHATDAALTSPLLIGINGSASEHTTYKVSVAYTLVPWNASAFTGCDAPRDAEVAAP